MRVILASASPRRRELLARLTYPFDVRPAQIDESRREEESPEAYVRRMADEKALRVSAREGDALVLAADTVVCVDADVLGKPRGAGEAGAMLAKLSGRTHRVLTAIAWARGARLLGSELVSSQVAFRELGGAEIERYVAGGEPADKAGAYAIQGEGSAFIRGVAGSVTSVIGLPLAETEALGRRFGLRDAATPLPAEAIALRYRSVLGEIAATAVASGRRPEHVRLIAVSKGHPAAAALAAIDAGARDLGENYVQEGAVKRASIAAARGGSADVRWHLIGRLQRNKAKLAAREFDLVHTIDRTETANALLRAAPGPVAALVQVNVAADPAKAGVAPESLASLLRELRSLDGLRIEGLMTIGAASAGCPAARAGFRELRELLEEVRARGLLEGDELSMGMSGDYDAAIAEGATLVRLGTAIFGPRAPVAEVG
jgi:MAF protein